MLVLRFPYAKERLRFANLAVHGILWRLEPGAITISGLAKEKAAEVIISSDLRQYRGGADGTRTRDLRRDRPAF
jgi:hypothetical protein